MPPSPLPSAQDHLESLGQWWHPIKMGMEHAFAFSPDVLHVLVGVTLHLILAGLLGVSVARPSPWLGVLGLELLNEWSDLSFEVWPVRAMQWGESGKDVFLTMALPTFLLILARWYPSVLVEAHAPILGPSKTNAASDGSAAENSGRTTLDSPRKISPKDV